MAACLDDDLVGALVARRLGPADAAAARDHLDICIDCRRLVASLARSVSPEEESTVVDDASHEVSIALTIPGSMVDALPLTGKVIADKYRILRVIGKGGMGCVVAAEHLQLQIQVALKLLHPQRVFDEEARARLGREACAAARIASPYAARVFDVGATEDGSPFMVMELLDGHDLGEELKSRGKVGWREAVRWTLQACHALAEAHRNGIVHRDLKPQNVVVLDGPGTRSIKLVDFGISKFLDGQVVDDAHTGEARIGTPRYMAPEQLKLGRAVDQRTDVWAIGVILHELVSGAHPFARGSLQAQCAAVLGGESASIEPTLAPAGLGAVIRRCLEKRPEDRYSSARGVAEALAPWAVAGSASLLEDMGVVPLRRASLASMAEIVRPTVLRRVGLGLAAFVAVAALALMVGVATRTRTGGSSAAAAVATPPASTAASRAPATPVSLEPVCSTPTVDLSAEPAVPPESASTSSGAPSHVPHHFTPPRRLRNAGFGDRR